MDNARITEMAITSGGAVRRVVSGGVWTFVFVAAFDIAAHFFRDEETTAELLATLTTSALNTAISTAAGAAAAWAAGAIAAAAGVAAPVALPLAAGVVVAIGVGLVLNWLDERYGITDWLAAEIDQSLQSAQQISLQGVEQMMHGMFVR
jgi:hypothetical protein